MLSSISKVEALNYKSLHAATPVSAYSTYFLQGLDKRQLTSTQQQQMAKFIETDPKGTSFLIYNSSEAERKIQNWK